MPTDYTGSPTAAQAPSPAPDPDNFPIVRIPIDTEAANVSSVNQEFKTLADHVAWLKQPRAFGSAWIQAIKVFRNAILQRRWGIDHMGFPGGKLQAWQEDWANVGFVTVSAAGGPTNWAGPWQYYIQAAAVAGSIQAMSADADGGGNALSPRSCWLRFSGGISGGANNNVLLVEHRLGATRFDPTNCMVMEWEQSGANSIGAHNSGGIATATQAGMTGALTSFFGVGFVFRSGTDTNWQACHRALAAGAPTFVDTGVAIGSGIVRMRIEVYGASTADDGNARVIWYINGAIVANVAVDIGKGGAIPFFRQFTNGSSLYQTGVGHVAFRANLAAGDVFI